MFLKAHVWSQVYQECVSVASLFVYPSFNKNILITPVPCVENQTYKLKVNK